MNTNDFNYGQTIFLASFLAAELPSGLVSKKLGADVWIPTIMVGWSITAGAQAFLSNRAGFYTIKALLGLLMGGFIPVSKSCVCASAWYAEPTVTNHTISGHRAVAHLLLQEQ